MGATIKRILLFLLFAVLGGLIGILVVFPDHFESFNDYQINVLDYSGRATTLYARGERTGLLGQHEAIISLLKTWLLGNGHMTQGEI